MKKKISVPTVVLLAHLIICTFLSFDWSFLEGMYMGFGPTFLIVWGFSLPMPTACITIFSVIIPAKNKRKITILEKLTAAVGGIILLIYLASACGLLKNFAFDFIFIYVFVFLGMFFIFGCWCYKKVKRRNKT